MLFSFHNFAALLATGLSIFLPVTRASAQYAEWYLECTVGERRSPPEIYAHPYETIKRVDVYMPFNNGGSLNDESAKVIYKDSKDPKNDSSPFSLFNTVRFNRGKSYVTGKVIWTGLEPRVYPLGWSIRGEVVVDTLKNQATYLESLLQGNKILGYIKSKCIFNNPN